MALHQMTEVFQVVPRKWRGIGAIPASGLALREAYAALDAERHFNVDRNHGRGGGRVHYRPDLAGPQETARLSLFSKSIARPSDRWAARWFPPKAPVRRIIGIGGEGRGIAVRAWPLADSQSSYFV